MVSGDDRKCSFGPESRAMILPRPPTTPTKQRRSTKTTTKRPTPQREAPQREFPSISRDAAPPPC